MTLHVKDSGTWKQAQEVFVKDGGTWKTCADVLIKDAGTWKSVLYQAGSQEFSAGSSGTFTVPAGVYTITVSMIAGGGGGSGGDDYGSAGGGSGGYYQNYSYSVTPGQSISYSVGSGAAGTSGTTSLKGGNTVFGALTVTGGANPVNNNPATVGLGGSPGGTNGQAGNQSSGSCPAIAGDGASSLWGTGGASGDGGCPGQTGSNGSAGTGYGSGGGGGGNNSTGGAGAPGRLWLSW
jgi:hypothetical protein